MEQLPQYPYRPEGWAKQIYPMPSFPTLLVDDVERSSRWYQDVLGFADVFTLRGRDGTSLVTHLRWCTFADLLLTPARGAVEAPRGRGITLNFATVSADEVAEMARRGGAVILDGPIDRPWNARDVTIADPDGYRLTFTAPQPHVLQEPPQSFDEVMARARDAADRSR
jgi:catechol 2,3-dioxygenase-like lactoylglutathione lyase family enzyme